MNLFKNSNFQKWYLPLVLLLLFLVTTNPRQLPLPLILIALVMLLISSYSIIKHLLFKLSRGDKPLNNLIAGILSFIVLTLVVLQSINQLTFRDGLLFSLLAVGVAVYIHKLQA